jgi:hypothetical protein
MSRLAPQLTYEAHLNTFYCPIGATPINRDESTTDARLLSGAKSMLLFPNPTSGLLFADLSDWQGESVSAAGSGQPRATGAGGIFGGERNRTADTTADGTAKRPIFPGNPDRKLGNGKSGVLW